MESPGVDRARGRAATVLQDVAVSLRGSVAGKELGHMSQITAKVLGQLPSTGSWLHAGKNSRVSRGREKEGLFREETHFINRE